MSKNNSPLNFIGGMMGNAMSTLTGSPTTTPSYNTYGGAFAMMQRAQNAMNAPGGLAGNMNNASVYNGGQAQIAAQAAGQNVGGADANSVSATGFNPNTGNTTPTYNNLNSLQNSSANTTVGNVATDAMAGVGGASTPQVQTGSFSPDASMTAEGIFGSEESRGIQPYKKPLINF
mgnify:CR=1 FL=1